jgi:monoamine oxidase
MAMSRRNLLTLIGLIGGSTAMFDAMTQRGHAAPVTYKGPPALGSAPKRGNKVIVIGAGLAGLTAAYELRKAGYEVEVLEYNSRIGGRCWTIRGGDRYTELGGETQHCEFDKGLYMNPGPWRISHTHRAILDYCQRFDVAMEPFLQINFNGYVHSKDLFGGKPQRYGQVIPDFQGYIAELLSRAMSQSQLDQALDKDDLELLQQLLSSWGGLDKQRRYAIGEASTRMRGPQSIDLSTGKSELSQPLNLKDVMRLCDNAGLWRGANHVEMSQFQMPLFQPVGGMDMIAKAFAQRVESSIRLQAKVTEIRQNEQGVRVHYEDGSSGGQKRVAQGDWCVCTIPFSILSQIPMDIGSPMKAGIDAIPYNSEVKIGLQFKRRFWEQDEAIYGGFSITDLPIREIGYPSGDLNRSGKGVLYGAVVHSGPISYELGGMTPKQRIDVARKYGEMIHPQYKTEYENGMAVAWYRNPYSMGCTAKWNEALIRDHLQNIRAFDGRIALAGEGVSVHGWQDGAIMSALDVVERLHQRAVAG